MQWKQNADQLSPMPSIRLSPAFPRTADSDVFCLEAEIVLSFSSSDALFCSDHGASRDTTLLLHPGGEAHLQTTRLHVEEGFGNLLSDASSPMTKYVQDFIEAGIRHLTCSAAKNRVLLSMKNRSARSRLTDRATYSFPPERDVLFDVSVFLAITGGAFFSKGSMTGVAPA